MNVKRLHEVNQMFNRMNFNLFCSICIESDMSSPYDQQSHIIVFEKTVGHKKKIENDTLKHSGSIPRNACVACET